MRALLFALVLAPGLALAVGRPSEMLPNPAAEARAQEIGRELRCMVCQNQSIEDSEADLARDLRRLVRERVAAGESSDAVRDYVHARYGDFVLLRPPFNWVTAPLWALPVIVLGIGGLVLLRMRRRQAARTGPAPLTDEERARLAALEKEL
ncbi:cytochrome c-type biogenesis protein CcmH [Roseomonas rosea]|uniref:Cytochrome c-type biogenesis protein n=1 Tax=Muricoccus roseus TaxID=198092 RepID=A0A1M6H318_9PROT|nr:cytochrome c-type biogenesis protein [Roseomonas rosea]SHJ16601.1 cytochrome c-type biogenesis protein CcmH [Roseomonas rosea]